MPPKQKNKKTTFPKIASYLTILLSLLAIYFSFKNNILNFNSSDDKNNLMSLYAKTEHPNQDNFTSKVAIKNGCGKKYLGMTYKQYLLDIGYDVTEATNATHPSGENHFGHSSTKILFHKKNKKSAIYLSKEIGVNKNQIFEDYKEGSFHDLTLILGQNFSKLKSYKTAQTFNPFNND